MNQREKQILCGLFFSKFDREGLAYLGFDGFKEAFNVVGYGLSAKPASIKNYRDELDPCFQNTRKGWHKRPLREHCHEVMTKYQDHSLEELGDLVKTFLYPDSEFEQIPKLKEILARRDPACDSSFAKRLIIGRAAEQYFLSNITKMKEFIEWTAVDTTLWGCGFDFKLTNKSKDFRAVEVKGLREKSGNILMTDLEREIAKELKDKYFLIVVRNFIETPFHTILRDPLNGPLKLTKNERLEKKVTWSANIPA